MQYNPPSGALTANESYVGKNIPAGQQGSKVPRAAIENTQREIVNAIAAAGIAPTNDDLYQLTRVIRGGQLDYSIDTGTADAMVVAVALPHALIKAGLPICFIKGAAANATSAPKLTITGPNGLGPVTQGVVKANGATLTSGDLPAGAMLFLRSDGSNFRLLSARTDSDILGLIFANVQTRPTGNIIVNVDPINGNDANPGTVAYPFKTMNGAVAGVSRQYNVFGFTIQLNCIPGIYAPLFLDGFTGAKLVVNGNFANPDSCQINNTNANVAGVTAVHGSQVEIVGFRLDGNGRAVECSSGSTIILTGPKFNTAADSHIYVTYGGTVIFSQNYQIASLSGSHLIAGPNGAIILNGVRAAILGVPAFTQFALANGGFIDASVGSNTTGSGFTFTGTATGKRYTANQGGGIYVAGNGENVFPGSIAGTKDTTTGSWYV